MPQKFCNSSGNLTNLANLGMDPLKMQKGILLKYNVNK